MRANLRRLKTVATQRINSVLAYIRTHKRLLLKRAGIGFLALFVSLTLFAKLNNERLYEQIQTTKTDMQLLQNQLNEVMRPEAMAMGQPDLSIDYVIAQTDPEARETHDVSKPSAILIFLNQLPRPSWHGGLFKEAASMTRESEELTRYHHRIISAMEPLLEYNPRADLADETLNELAIQTRIDNAKQGLDDVQEALRNASSSSIDDSGTGELLRIVSLLQGDLRTFESERTKESWYEAVEKAHTDIQNNRQAFWDEKISAIYAKISYLLHDLTEIELKLR